MKTFTCIVVLFGIFVVTMDNANPSLLISYSLLSIIGFSINAIASLHKESASRWDKYKLTTPVRRADIVKSYYASQIIWMLTGTVFAGIGIGLSIAIHGVSFDLSSDVFMIFIAGIAVSFLLGAIFFPLFYLGGVERNEALVVISLSLAVGVFMGFVSLINIVLEEVFSADMEKMRLPAGIALLIVTALIFLASYPAAAGIFGRREY